MEERKSTQASQATRKMLWTSVARASRKVVAIGGLWVVIFFGIVFWPKISTAFSINLALGTEMQDPNSLRPLLYCGIGLMVLGVLLNALAKRKCRKIDAGD